MPIIRRVRLGLYALAWRDFGSTMLKNGMQLRYPIRDARGTLLMDQGAVVTDRLHAILQTRGISLELQASMKVLEGGERGLEIPITKLLFRMGRRPDCELQLA